MLGFAGLVFTCGKTRHDKHRHYKVNHCPSAVRIYPLLTNSNIVLMLSFSHCTELLIQAGQTGRFIRAAIMREVTPRTNTTTIQISGSTATTILLHLRVFKAHEPRHFRKHVTTNVFLFVVTVYFVLLVLTFHRMLP